MSSDTNTPKLDISPLTVIVSESLDPRVRRKMEAEQQASIKTYQELTNDMQMKEDLNKIKQEVNKDGEDNDPFKKPDAVEDSNQPAGATSTATPPAPDNTTVSNTPPASDNTAPPPAATPPVAQNTPPANNAAPPANDNAAPAATPPANDNKQDATEEDLSAAFETHGTNLPKDLLRRVLKNYIALESGDHDTGPLDHIKIFVYVDLSQNGVNGDTLESVQTLRDPENTIVVIKEDGSPDADTTLRARKVAETLTNRGVKVFYDLDSAMSYLNDLYDVVSGRTKGDK